MKRNNYYNINNLLGCSISLLFSIGLACSASAQAPQLQDEIFDSVVDEILSDFSTLLLDGSDDKFNRCIEKEDQEKRKKCCKAFLEMCEGEADDAFDANPVVIKAKAILAAERSNCHKLYGPSVSLKGVKPGDPVKLSECLLRAEGKYNKTVKDASAARDKAKEACEAKFKLCKQGKKEPGGS